MICKNAVLKAVGSVCKKCLIGSVVLGMVFSAGCGMNKPNHNNPSGSDVVLPNIPGVEDKDISVNECLGDIDIFVKKYFNLDFCEVQSMATQKEENGSPEISVHSNLNNKESFEAVDFVFRIKADETDKLYTVIVPVPTSIYLTNENILTDTTGNISISRNDIKSMSKDKLTCIKDIFEKTSSHYGYADRSLNQSDEMSR